MINRSMRAYRLLTGRGTGLDEAEKAGAEVSVEGRRGAGAVSGEILGLVNDEVVYAVAGQRCFGVGAMKAVVGRKVPADAKVTASVGIGPRSEGGFGLDIDLKAPAQPGAIRRQRDLGVPDGLLL
jgi:hypothetical protein